MQRRICGGYCPPMQPITIKRGRTLHCRKMRLAKDQHLVQALATQGADQTFRNACHGDPGEIGRSHSFDPGRKDMPVGTVVVAYQISRD